MKKPPHKMTHDELLDWIWENDFDYWAVLYLEHFTPEPARLRELFEDEVRDTIWDEIYYGREYLDYIVDEDDEDE